MREIIFRGQTRRKGEKVRMDGTPVESRWLYGGIFQGVNRSIIYSYDPLEKYTVYSDTVGQYTGLMDKNGKRIFEGDVVEVNFEGQPHACVVGVVCYENGVCMIKHISSSLSLCAYRPYCTVIGNIHDNPDLVKEL